MLPASGRDAAERGVDMFFFQRDGCMSRILTIGASVVQHKLDQMRQARQRVILRD
jgi:hypothetical protein